MSHTLTKRLHGEEEALRNMLEGTLLRYGAMLGSVLLIIAICLAVFLIER